MAQIIGLPKLSPTMEEGVLVRWTKKEGDSIEPGDCIAEVETDKANMDFNLEDEGVLLKLLINEGDTVKAGEPVAILGELNEPIEDLIQQIQAQSNDDNNTETTPSPIASTTPNTPPPVTPPKRPAAPPTMPPLPPEATKQFTKTTPNKGHIVASPLAKKLAQTHHIALDTLQGTGPGNRIIERDVQAAITNTPNDKSNHATPSSLTTGQSSTAGTTQNMLPIQKSVAKQMSLAKQTIPHFYLTRTCNADGLISFRQALNATVTNKNEKISFNDILIKLAAVSLAQTPQCNVSYVENNQIHTHEHININVAIALTQGIVTPVIHNADHKGIAQIHNEVRDFIQHATNKTLKASMLQGGTFTLSNLGMSNIDHFEPIINLPQAAILGIGAIRKEPVVRDETIVVGHRISFTLSCDHRVIDGALGAQYLNALAILVENPQFLSL